MKRHVNAAKHRFGGTHSVYKFCRYAPTIEVGGAAPHLGAVYLYRTATVGTSRRASVKLRMIRCCGEGPISWTETLRGR